VQIIACGNPGRGDDAAGWRVAERLRELGLEALGVGIKRCTGDATALLRELPGDGDIILLDAVMTGAAPGTIHHWDGIPPFQIRKPSSTHALGVAEALKLAMSLGRLPKSLQVFGIEAEQFELGSPLSPRVKQATEDLAQRIQTSIQAEQAVR